MAMRPGWPAGCLRSMWRPTGVNATKGMIGAQYVVQSVAGTIAEWQTAHGITPSAPVASVINRYNPTLDFRNYMIPALMVVLLIIICGFLPALNLVSEKESGTIEAINVTPVSRLTFVLSKLIPFWVIGLLVVTIGMLVGWLVYGLVPTGNVGAIYLATILFSLVMSSLGVSIANSSSTMLQSVFVMFAFIIVFQLMGGLFTPVSSMPGWAQCITYGNTAALLHRDHAFDLSEGATVADLGFQYMALAGFALLLAVVAAITYRKQS